jgi:uncharacterized protein YjiS (DUF1127 family)
MLMKSPTSPSAARRFANSLDATIGWLLLGARQLHRAIKHRRDAAILADQDDYLLADIGLTRSDVHHAIARPLWHDPTETLRQRAGGSRRASVLKRCGSADHLNPQALVALDDSDLGNLSPGCRVRHDARHQRIRVCLAGLAASLIACLGAADAVAQPACKPGLAITDVQYSPMKPPTLQRQWSATITIDTSRCADATQGMFEIGFSRLKENAPEIDFYERFRWQSPSVKVSVDFWADEAVEHYWLGNVAPCSCRG